MSIPYGVVAAIAPWNVPLVLAVLKIGPALAAGNAVVLKPSELTPYSILRVAELAYQAGVPTGQLAVLPGLGPETGSALVRHPLMNYVSFTDSTATGKQVMIDAANIGLKPVCLELGGKSPQLVFRDAPSLDRKLMRLDPDVIFLLCDVSDNECVRHVYAEPEYQTLRAVRNRRVYAVPAYSFPNEFVEQPLLIRWLAEVLYPRKMPRQFRAEYEETYQNVYRYSLSDDQIDKALLLSENLNRPATQGLSERMDQARNERHYYY